MLVHFLMVVIFSSILYANGETAARGVRRFGRRLAAERGENAVILAGQAIRAVALGVGVTAVVQTVLGGIGLAVAGVPAAGFLSAVMLILCIAQLGPALIMFPAVGWMYWTGENGWGTVLLVWSIVVTALDNIMRPVLIKKGADLPLLLIFAGVIGGMLGFGMIGIFVGPVVLAVTYTLLRGLDRGRARRLSVTRGELQPVQSDILTPHCAAAAASNLQNPQGIAQSGRTESTPWSGAVSFNQEDSMTRVGSLKHFSCGVFWTCFLAILAPSVAPAQEAPPRPFLRKVIQLDDAQLAAVEKGEVVTKMLPTTDKPEIAAFGVVKTAGTVDQLLTLARDVKKFRQVPQIPEMGYFSSPAKIEDLAASPIPRTTSRRSSGASREAAT